MTETSTITLNDVNNHIERLQSCPLSIVFGPWKLQRSMANGVEITLQAIRGILPPHTTPLHPVTPNGNAWEMIGSSKCVAVFTCRLHCSLSPPLPWNQAHTKNSGSTL
jgi:hypothetical protein